MKRMQVWSLVSTLTVIVIILILLLTGAELKEGLAVLLFVLALKLPVFCFCQKRGK